MSLTDLPTIKPSENQVFLIAIAIIIFVFYFTSRKESDQSNLSK